jgi:hypothetical protein
MISGASVFDGTMEAPMKWKLWITIEHEKQVADEHYAGRNSRRGISKAQRHHSISAG